MVVYSFTYVDDISDVGELFSYLDISERERIHT